MEQEYGNIYRKARRAADMTQELWAELIGVSVDAVRQYEAGKILPSDDVVLAMSAVSELNVICYWHLMQKSSAARRILPELKEKTLPEAVISLLLLLQDFQRGGLQDLLRLAADGKIDQGETVAFGEALSELDGVIRGAYEVQYAREAE